MKFGIMTALVTPVNPDMTLNKEVLIRVIEDQLSHGIHSFCALGGTGENAAVPFPMREKVLEVVVETVNHRVPVVAGVVELGVHDAIKCAKMAQSKGVDVLLVNTPFGGSTTAQTCIDYYNAIRQEVSLPIIIYNFPGRMQFNATPDVVGAILDNVPGIVAIKECAERFEQTMEQLRRFGKRVQVLSGNEYLAPWEMLMGAEGAFLASSNLLPGEWVKMYDLAQAKKSDELTAMGMKYCTLQRLLFKEPNPAPLKYAMQLQGFQVGGALPPGRSITDKLKDDIKTEMRELGII